MVIECVSVDRTLVMTGYQKYWQSSLQQTVCSALQAKRNVDGSVDIKADFESNGGISLTIVNVPCVIVWA